MTKSQVSAQWASFFDHTALKPDTTPQMIEQLCIEAREFGFYGVCVNTWYLPQIVRCLEGSTVVPLVVVGFPLGAMHTEAKIAETKWAIAQGAKEIDTVVNIGAYRGGDESNVRRDFEEVVKAAGDVPVKIILETGYLEEYQIGELTRWAVDAGAKFIKTSTGMGPRGASVKDIQVIRATLDDLGSSAQGVGIKASGGIRTAEFMRELVAAGATRIGASASVEILANL